MHFKVVIPARYESTRFPGKLLSTINGQTIISHVVDLAKKSGAEEVVVATDDQRIAESVATSDCHVIMTSKTHASGTDRIAEVALRQNWSPETLVVNVQGDEPFIPPALINSVAHKLWDTPDASASTACFPVSDREDLFNPNLVKVVLNHQNYALYFSRAPIPWSRDTFSDEHNNLPHDYPGFGHIGIYGYRAKFLSEYSNLPFSPLEAFEKLEQLRMLQAGRRMVVTHTQVPPALGIDTPGDLERARELLSKL